MAGSSRSSGVRIPQRSWCRSCSTRCATRRRHAIARIVDTRHTCGFQWEVCNGSLLLDLDMALEALDDVGALAYALDELHDDVEELFVAAVEPPFAAAPGVRGEELA